MKTRHRHQSRGWRGVSPQRRTLVFLRRPEVPGFWPSIGEVGTVVTSSDMSLMRGFFAGGVAVVRALVGAPIKGSEIAHFCTFAALTAGAAFWWWWAAPAVAQTHRQEAGCP